MRHEDDEELDNPSGCNFLILCIIAVLSAGFLAASISEVCHDNTNTLSWFWSGVSSMTLVIAVVGLIAARKNRYGKDQEE